jgi:hypothetical protein
MTDERHDLGEQGQHRADARIALKHALASGAPMAIPSYSRRTKARSEMRAMSISRFGRASRIAMSGTRLWPPAMTRASSPAASIAQAWSRSAGLAYSKGAGFIERGA